MTYGHGHLHHDCLYTGISSGPNARCRVWEAFTFNLLLTVLRAPVLDITSVGIVYSNYFALVWVHAKYCDERVCMSVCLYVYLSACISPKPLVQTSRNFLQVLPVSVVPPLTTMQYVIYFRFCG